MKVTRTQVRIPTDLLEWVKRQAKDQNRSMNAQLIEILEQERRRSS